jgi:predicted negative regulator of RcsB-dependent stress response
MLSVSPSRLCLTCLLLPFLLSALAQPAQAESAADDSERLQELLYREILYLYRQEDYTGALTRWQVAAEKGLLPELPAESELLLARLKLAYGMDVEAGLELTRLMTADLPPADRNQSWYELARSFFHKGYPEAALEALEQVSGTLPETLAGDLRLLRAHVLMSLERYPEAAKELEGWSGPAELEPFADYNRGIALVRAGRDADAVRALEGVATLAAQSEEELALRDKANLSLGYVYLQQNAFDRARNYLQQVRLNSPYSNRALLAMGWIAQQQGRSDEALAPWTELRNRNVTDPAVQESLLAVPSLHRELQALGMAATQYEDAVAVYSRELEQVNEAVEALQQGELPDELRPDSASSTEIMRNDPAGPYYGPLLANRRVQLTLQGHTDLQLMLDNVDEGLQNIDRLADRLGIGQDRQSSAGNAGGGSDSGDRRRRSSRDRPAPPGRDASGSSLPPAPEWVVEWEGSDQAGEDFRGIPLLPEINLPLDEGDRLPESEFTGLPEPDFTGLPTAAEFHSLPPESVDIGLPQSELAWPPETGRFSLPDRREKEHAYPDSMPRATVAGRDKPAPRQRRITRPAALAGRSPDDAPASEALQQLATELAAAAERMARLGDYRDTSRPDSDLAARIAALRERILALRERIAIAIADYESYTRALALAELQGRQRQLEDYLEQARLELAKTYDQASDR